MRALQKATPLSAGTTSAPSPSVAGDARAVRPVQAPILAIDYGRKRIGLAVSDQLGIVARPLETLERKNRRDDVRRLREIARAHAVRRIVVGHPLRLDGTPGEMAEEVERFAVRLEKQLGLPMALVDERLTSWEVEQMAGEMRWLEQAASPGTMSARKRSRKPGATRDAMAAAVILRDYLNHERETP
ncbi:MAG TPA: Holliday junction resolvase RuvX [Candidatus Acidoferrales bacterium]|nr:Holliday junction resolvase RuvX [Candidatus Acidoferrales bacterium]